MTRFTPLESDILDALAWELREIAPDLAGQFAGSLPGSRRNTGAGLFTELIVDRSRPAPLTTLTGRYGTVHAMVGDLPDPIAFQVELRQGCLLSLHGDAYGQDTRAIDFARAPFDQIFTLDDRGESVAFDPGALIQPAPLPDLHQPVGPEPPPPANPPLITIGPITRVDSQQEARQLLGMISGVLTPSAKRQLTGLISGALTPSAEPDAGDARQGEKEEAASVPISTWIAIIAGVVVVTVLFELNWFFSVFLVVVIGRLVRRPGVLSAFTRATRRLGQYEDRPPER
ncbi:hypothetical protein KB221_04540 [Aquidulcibacter paucihalophilus]|nr:hypothetical protein KB221_04540 [Aquidulcibacter paucihalophilus]